jgi:hypothetical protein
MRLPISQARVKQCDCGVTHAVYVVETYAVAGHGADGRPQGIGHYEIQVAPDQDPDAPRVALIATDPRIVDCLLAAEDLPRRYDLTWHRIETRLGPRYLIDRTREYR